MSTVQLKEIYLHPTPVQLEGDLATALTRLWKAADGVLLGQAFDGILWGRLREGRLLLAKDVIPEVGALLRAETLLSLRLFNVEQELRVWRTEKGLGACRIVEATNSQQLYAGYQEQCYELLRQVSKENMPVPAPFVLLQGLAGQCHAPPGEPSVPRRLRVRHYLQSDLETGLLRLAEYRLLKLES